MDPFWGITLSTIVIARFWKKENQKRKERKEFKEQQRLAAEKEAARPIPLTEEEKEAQRVQKEIDKRRERDIADLRKQGYTDELIAVIIPTINNGQ